MNIPVFIRGHPPSSLQNPPQLGGLSGVSVAPSIAGNNVDEQIPSPIKRTSRGRIPSISHNGIGTDNDNKSNSIPGQDSLKALSNSFKTFYLVRDSECYRPKLYVDSTANETEPIEQINSLYMRGINLIFSCLNDTIIV